MPKTLLSRSVDGDLQKMVIEVEKIRIDGHKSVDLEYTKEMDAIRTSIEEEYERELGLQRSLLLKSQHHSSSGDDTLVEEVSDTLLTATGDTFNLVEQILKKINLKLEIHRKREALLKRRTEAEKRFIVEQQLFRTEEEELQREEARLAKEEKFLKEEYETRQVRNFKSSENLLSRAKIMGLNEALRQREANMSQRQNDTGNQNREIRPKEEEEVRRNVEVRRKAENATHIAEVDAHAERTRIDNGQNQQQQQAEFARREEVERQRQWQEHHRRTGGQLPSSNSKYASSSQSSATSSGSDSLVSRPSDTDKVKEGSVPTNAYPTSRSYASSEPQHSSSRSESSQTQNMIRPPAHPLGQSAAISIFPYNPSKRYNPLPPPPQIIQNRPFMLPMIENQPFIPPIEPKWRERVRYGFWNRRGDHLTQDGYIVYAPLDKAYPPELQDYPNEEEGYQNHERLFTSYIVQRPELRASLPSHGKPPERPYESFIVYHYK